MDGFIERPRYTCALGGAIAAVTALPGAVPIIHSPSGCGGNLAWTQAGGCGLQVGGYCGGISMPGSNIQEREVVFGGTEKLQTVAENSLKIMDGELYFILTSCVTEIIGDDVGSVAGALADNGSPLIYAETGGFRGNSYHGYDLVLKSLWENYVQPSAEKQSDFVNVWGIPPYFDVFWRGNLQGIRDALAKLGLKVNTFFTGEDSLETIRKAGSAGLNIIVSDLFGHEAAKTALELHNIPYLTTPPPIGPGATGQFLRQVGEKVGIPSAKVEQAVTRATRHYYNILQPITDCFNDMDLQRYAVVIGDANYAPAVASFLAADLGWIPEVVAVTDILNNEQQLTLQRRFSQLPAGLAPKLVFSPDTTAIRQEINSHWSARSQGGKYRNPPNPAFVIGSSLDRELAKDLNAPHLSVSFPVANRAVLDRGYTGYSGGLRLMEDLISAIIVNR